ncbi:MAG: hypothetical protein Q8P18_30715 [Pseudomonadota bacterium]|nr:hypothetical protein [Pseudomonadota bacterium]
MSSRLPLSLPALFGVFTLALGCVGAREGDAPGRMYGWTST